MVDSTAIAAHLATARPRALAALVRRCGDLDRAEEAFQEASVRALRIWPSKGLPRDPTGWLVVVGRNALVDDQRRSVRESPLPTDGAFGVAVDSPEAKWLEDADRAELKDDVLRLLFMCCHRELSIPDQLALALRIIGGLSVAEIARAFLVQPKAMEQRITRAKKKAAAVATRLATPTLTERSERLEAVSTMIYLLFNEGYASSRGDAQIRETLCEEAIRLARLLLQLFPSQPESMGLLALCLLQHSRRRAREQDDGTLVPLDQQDRGLWDRPCIAEATVLLEKALRTGRPGPYQVQAAIAAVHCGASTAEETDWAEIERLYAVLELLQPTAVVQLNRAVATAKASGARSALPKVDALESELNGYLPFHTTRASLRAELGDIAGALEAYVVALELDPPSPLRRHILERIESLRSGG